MLKCVFVSAEPNPPEVFEVSATRSDAILVSLAPPQGEFDGYVLSYTSEDGSQTGSVTLEPDVTEYLVDGLDSDTVDGTEFTFTVYTFSGNGDLRIESEPEMKSASTRKYPSKVNPNPIGGGGGAFCPPPPPSFFSPCI